MVGRTMGLGVLQVGGIQPSETRPQVVARLVQGLREGKGRGADFVVFPELTLTTFFPRYWVDDIQDMNHHYETDMPSAQTAPLFEEAKELGVGFCLGYAELTPDGRRFNTAITVDRAGRISGKYRKIHLPGHANNIADRKHQHLEKRYFEVGDLGFGVFNTDGVNIGMAICNDRRWSEVYRILSLQSADLVVLGYNTPLSLPWWTEQPHTAMHAHLICLQAGAYQNSMWVAAAAKSGTEDGAYMMGGSVIVAPNGEIVARTASDEDELIVAEIDLDMAEEYRRILFDYAAHRRIEEYGLISERLDRGAPLPVDF